MNEARLILWLIVCGIATFYCGFKLRRIGIWLKSNASAFVSIKSKPQASLTQEELSFLKQYRFAYALQFVYAVGGIVVFPAIAVSIVA